MPTLIANILLYQGAWFACVLAAAARRPMLGLGVSLVAVLWHLWRAPEPVRELRLIGAALLAGAMFETLLVASGWVRVDQHLLLGGMIPFGLVALWGAFATTLNVSLRALRTHPWIAALVGALGAPLAYAAGARLGAFDWTASTPALLLIAAGWALLLPLLLRSARRLDGFQA